MKMRTALLLALSTLVAAILLAAQTAPEVALTAEPSHHLAFANEYVRAFRVEVAPHASTLLHRHSHDYLFVTLGASQVENDVVGKPSVTMKLQDGETRFVPGDFAHVAKNLADTPFRNVTIELLQDAEARKNPPKWDEERGLGVLEGGTRDVMFVKDGARVSEVELQPGASIPSHHHTGPHLLVALTDLDLRNDVEGKPSLRAQISAGDVRWVPGGFTHTVTNMGKQPARLITVEFK